MWLRLRQSFLEFGLRLGEVFGELQSIGSALQSSSKLQLSLLNSSPLLSLACCILRCKISCNCPQHPEVRRTYLKNRIAFHASSIEHGVSTTAMSGHARYTIHCKNTSLPSTSIQHTGLLDKNTKLPPVHLRSFIKIVRTCSFAIILQHIRGTI
jgi:hypothetical protein